MDLLWFSDLLALQATEHFSLAMRKCNVSQPDWNIKMSINLIRTTSAQDPHPVQIWDHVRQHHTPDTSTPTAPVTHHPLTY
jgi:hypothetical protein